ncbi:MAG TPA: sugar isomerase [Actinomycetales bacterium]|nr:sugar isomerase [Actinomycetales bacterium]
MSDVQPGAHLAAEIATQPDDWLAAAGSVDHHRAALPQPGERVAVVGCGTSLYMARSYAALREEAGAGLTDAWPASEARLDRGYDRVLAITRSGTTTEVLELLGSVRGRIRSSVILADRDTPAGPLSDDIVALPTVDEQSVVQTRFATTVLALLRASLGEDLSAAAAEARVVLDLPVETAIGRLPDVEQLTFVGRGWTVGLAEEAALKLRESAQFWAESYPAMEYRHGPISIATTGRATWAIGAVPEGLDDEVRATGAHFEHAERDGLAELVRVHRLCLEVSRRRGLDPDVPRHLTRSIILER